MADLGDGRYQNPILGGDYPDPSVVRVGSDYYVTHSSFMYVPGLLIWHSRDLVNWRPVCNALNEHVGSVYAPDLVLHEGTWYIYFPAGGTNWVVTAPAPEGPWSDPVDLQVGKIDPGHVVGPDGARYLHLSDGDVVQLAPDGLSVVGEKRHVYDGWRYPESWVVEGFCLESPKLTFHRGWYYLTSAEGGTAGPATSHMVVSARSRGPIGPWENSPHNPVVHTGSRDERWWSRGHGSLVDTPDGRWYIMYHGYERGYLTLGRQTLLEPIEWTDDDWFRGCPGLDVACPVAKPPGDAVPHGLALSDDFASEELGLQWRFYAEKDPAARYRVGDGVLVLRCKGEGPADSSPVLCIPVNHSYEADVLVTVPEGAEAGLIVFYGPDCYAGVGLGGGRIFHLRRGARSSAAPLDSSSVWLRLRNEHHELSLYYSPNGRTWTKMEKGIETSGYHHNVFGGFVSLRLGLYAAGTGEVTFSSFRYRGLD